MPHPSPDLSVAFVTLGCPKNEVDSDRMAAAVAASGYRLVEDVGDAGVVVVNTCAFIQDATEESIETVMELSREWVPACEGRHIVVAGCMVSRYGSDLEGELDEASAFVPVADEGSLLAVLERLTGIPAKTSAREDSQFPSRTARGASGYLKVSDGCDRSCAYCAIPSIRGPHVSRPLDEIVTEAAELVSLGAIEIVLIGQDVTAWGRDLPGPSSIAEVVEAVAHVPGVAWVRLMYAQPDGISDRLLEVMAENENVCRYLDLPLQHASSDVLRRMRRSGDAPSFLALLQHIRDALPGVTLRTTLIAGFPGETRDDAATLERFVAEAGFDYVGVFPYSPEEGTEAFSLANRVSPRTRRARAQRLRDLADRQGTARVEGLIGSDIEVLVEGYDDDEEAIVGRWRGQAPEIDGIVILDRGEAGDIVVARVTDTLGYDLIAEVL
jgi:ribosomal protein S12 methylthiotransferase